MSLRRSLAGTRRSAMTLHLVTAQVILGVEDVGADGALVLALRLPPTERLARPGSRGSFIALRHSSPNEAGSGRRNP
jgi:hypothetical protein